MTLDDEVGGAQMLEVTAAVIKVDDKYLICQRAADDACSLLWEFPGGKLEDDESLEQCIIREIEEELQLAVRVIDIFAETEYHFREKEVHFTFFNCRIVGGEMNLHVHHAAKWVRAEEMRQYDFMPADVLIVERLTEAE